MKKKTIEKISLRVLYLEDSPRDVEIIRELLIDAGYDLSMDYTEKKKEFTSLIRGNTYDVILSDFKLPGFDAFGALKLAMDICPYVPLICVSGSIGEETAIELIKQGAVDYILKDRLVRLPLAIKRALDESKEKKSRQIAEEALHESEERFRLLFNSSIDAVLLTSPSGDIFSANPAACKMFQCTEEELCLIGRRGIVDASDPRLAIALKERTRTGRFIGELTLLRKDGSKFSAEMSSVIFKGKKGSNHTSMIIRDITERKKAEEALRESERRLIETQEMAQLGHWIWDLRTGNVEWSEEVFKTFQLDPKKFTPQIDSIMALSPWPEDHERDKELIRKAMESHEKGTYEQKFLRPDKSIGYYVSTFQGKYDDVGNLIAIVGTVQDITERKRAEEALRESEEIFNQFLINSPVLVYIKDEQHRFKKLSKSFEDLFGKPTSELIGKDLYDLIPPELAKTVFADDRSVLKGGIGVKTEEKLGDIFYSSIKFPIHRGKGKPDYLGGFSINITERKLAEEKSRQLAAIVEFSNDAIIGKDLDGNIISWNKSAERIYGYTEAEIIGRPISILVQTGHEDEVPQILETIKRGKYVDHYETVRQRKDGQLISVAVTISPVKDTEGKIVSASVVARDITDRKQMEDALRESERQISLIYDTVGDVIYNLKVEKEGNYIFTSVNRCFLTVTGLQVNQIIGKRVQDVIPEPSLTLVLDKYAEAIRKKKIVRWEETTEYPTGLVTGEVSIAPVFDDQGHCTYLAGTVHDITERKRMEEALAKERFLMNMLMDKVPDGIYFKDKEGRFIRTNKSQAVRFGLSDPTEAVGKTDFDFFTEEHAQPAFEDEQEILRTGQPLIGLEEKETWPDGSETWVTTTKMPLRNKEGEIIGTFGISKDITERKQAEEVLRKNEEKLKELFEEAPVGYHETDELGNISAVNQTELKMLGFTTSEEMIGFPVWEFVVDNEESRKRTLGKLAGNLPPDKNSEQFIVRRNGTSFPALIDDIILRNEQGKITGIRTTLSDITERKRSEEALRETRDYLENLLSFANTPIVVWDPNFKITRFNVAIEKLTGYTLQEVIGKHLEMLLPLENKKSSLSLIAPTTEGDHLITVEIPILCKNGNVRTVVWSSANIYAADGQTLVSTIAQGQDITEQKKLQQELIQSQKMQSIGTLAGGIAHDFNNILGIILGYSSLMEKGTLSPAKFNESLGIIKNAVGRGAALVGQILTFARKTDVIFNPMNVTDLIHELLSMLRQTFPKVINFIEIIDKDIPLINADRTQIHQVMLNLCVNARDAMPQGGTITIKVEKQTKSQVQERIPAADLDSYICINVTDTGMGMDEATRRQIFDPFFTTKEKGKGTGLGLAVVYGVVQSHHGFIDVESEVGRGTTFWLYFPIPLASEQSADVSLLTESFATGGTETVLLVEDEEVLLEVVRLLLESKGYKVHTAKDGNEAINVYELHKQKIDIVLTDMGLPGISGMDVFTKLREIDPYVNVIVASGFFEKDVKSKLTAYGAKGFIQKPYTPDVVLKVIRQILDAKNNKT